MVPASLLLVQQQRGLSMSSNNQLFAQPVDFYAKTPAAGSGITQYDIHISPDLRGSKGVDSSPADFLFI
jgi:hypothetical protein